MYFVEQPSREIFLYFFNITHTIFVVSVVYRDPIR